MKKIFWLFLLTSMVTSCQTKSNSDQKTADTVAIKHEEHPQPDTALTLNNGVKWKVDSITMVNVGLLKNIIADAGKNQAKDFTTIAGQLQESLNKLISECKMTGADHDALHKWLEPLLEKVKALKTASAADGPAMVKDITDYLILFEKYFEQ
jgi:hypothetical protein